MVSLVVAYPGWVDNNFSICMPIEIRLGKVVETRVNQGTVCDHITLYI